MKYLEWLIKAVGFTGLLLSVLGIDAINDAIEDE